MFENEFGFPLLIEFLSVIMIKIHSVLEFFVYLTWKLIMQMRNEDSQYSRSGSSSVRFRSLICRYRYSLCTFCTCSFRWCLVYWSWSSRGKLLLCFSSLYKFQQRRSRNCFLSLADLTGSNINETQLKYVASLNGAILPNGTRMTSRN
jgi:hypothetical protein